MIFDVFENRSRYYSLHEGFKEAFEFLESCVENDPQNGIYEIRGKQVYAMVKQYSTELSENTKWESHRKYIDIQYVLSGKEIIEWGNIRNAVSESAYDKEKDIISYKEVDYGTKCRLGEGCFVIFYPEDLHKPKLIWDELNDIKKIVMKVALDKPNG